MLTKKNLKIFFIFFIILGIVVYFYFNSEKKEISEEIPKSSNDFSNSSPSGSLPIAANNNGFNPKSCKLLAT